MYVPHIKRYSMLGIQIHKYVQINNIFVANLLFDQ